MANKPVICANGKFREADPGATIAPEHLGLQDLIKAGPNVKLEYGTDGTITIVDVCCDAPAAPDVNNDGIVIDGVEFVPGSGGSANGVTEGERATLRVRFSEPLRAAGQVAFALSGTEFTAHPAYYMQVQSASPVAVQAGATHVDIAIQTTDDQIDEPTKRMNVTFTFNTSNKSGGFDVLDNDVAPLVCQFFSSFVSLTGTSVPEGQVARFQLTLTQPYPGEAPTTFPVSFSGSHVDSNRGHYPDRQVTVNPGDTSVQIEVPVHRDGVVVNGTTTLRVTIFGGQSGCPQTSAVFAQVDITNTDQPEHPSVYLRTFAVETAAITEGQTAAYLLGFSQALDPRQHTSIPYRLSGSEKVTHLSHYPDGVVYVTAGSVHAEIRVPTLDDTIIEPTTQLTATLWPDEPRYSRSVTVQVLDNDSVPLSDIVRITATPSTAAEGSRLCYTFQRINNHIYDAPLTLDIGLSGSEVLHWATLPPYPTPKIHLPNGTSSHEYCITLHRDDIGTGDRVLTLSAKPDTTGITGNMVLNTPIIDALEVLQVDARDDDFSSTRVPSSGGVTPNVLLNDTIDGGQALGRGGKLIKLSGEQGLVLNQDGTIAVSDSVPDGRHEMVYQLAHPRNEDVHNTATVIIEKGPIAPQTDIVSIRFVRPGTDTDVEHVDRGTDVEVLITMATDEAHVVNISWEPPGAVNTLISGTVTEARFSGFTHRFLIGTAAGAVFMSSSVAVRAQRVGGSNVVSDTLTIHYAIRGVSVTALEGSQSIVEGQRAQWVVSRSEPMPFDYTYRADLSGSEQDVHGYAPPVVTLPAGQTSVIVGVDTIDDNIVEPTLSLALTVRSLTDSTAHVSGPSVKVLDNDVEAERPYRVTSLTVTPDTVEAGNGQSQMTWTITIDRPVENTQLHVEGTWSGTHAPPAGTSFGINIPVGQQSVTFTTDAVGATGAGQQCLELHTNSRIVAINY